MLKIFKFTTCSLITFFYLSQAECCNYRLLDMNADSFNERLWSRTPISKELISEHLNFLDYENDQLIDQYAQNEKFKSLYTQYENKILSDEFKKFSNNCREIYEEYESLDPLVQAATHMMLERVAQKADKYLPLRNLTTTQKGIIAPKSEESMCLKVKTQNNPTKGTSLPNIPPAYFYVY